MRFYGLRLERSGDASIPVAHDRPHCLSGRPRNFADVAS